VAKNFVYVGSWLDDNKNNGGLRLYEQDSMTGELKFVEEYVKDLAVGSLCISPDRKYLYALDEIKRKPGRISCGGSVYAFAIDQDSGRLAYINSIPTAGAFPCYITIDSTGRYLLAVNYGSEDVTIRYVQDDNGSYVLQHSFDEASAVVIRTGNNGRLDGIADLARIEGTPSKAYEYFQSSPHPHSINIDPSDDFALITDRGCDQLIMYRLDRSSGKLARADILRTKKRCRPAQFSIPSYSAVFLCRLRTDALCHRLQVRPANREDI
jgi:6-phosphogluconolactonase